MSKLSILLGEMGKKPESEEEESESSSDSDTEVAAKAVLSAIKAGDAKKLAKALQLFVDHCDMDAEDESDDDE